MKAWRHCWLQHLHSRRPIDVGDRLQSRPPGGPNRKYSRHETRQALTAWWNIEIECCCAARHDWSERTERLTVLDFPVEPVAHFGRVRRREDAAVAQCARAELKSALHPTHDVASHQIISDLIDKRTLLEFHGEVTVFSCEPSQLRSITRRSPNRMIGYIAIRISEVNAVALQRRANCASSIPR